MNILIVANHYAVCSARYATEAFTRLEHTVKHIGPDKGRDIWGLTLPERYVWEADWEEMTSAPYPGDPELTIIMDSDVRITNATGSIRGQQIVWGVDNHVRDYRRDWFQQYFLAHRNVSVMRWEGETDCLTSVGEKYPLGLRQHLPCCYDPTQHTPSPIPWEERQYDVAILGMMYPQRMQAVRELKEAGLKVIWGCGAVGETYRDLHHQSRIALNLSFNGDVGQRVFETAAMGCVVMSDNCPDFELLKPEGIWLLEDGKPLVDQVKAILSDPEHAQLMIRLAQTWVKPHTWDNRAQTIVDWHNRTNLSLPVEDMPDAIYDDH